MLESISDYRKIAPSVYLVKTDRNLLHENGFVKCDHDHLCLEFKNILLDHMEEYLEHINNREEAIFENVLGKRLVSFFRSINRAIFGYKV